MSNQHFGLIFLPLLFTLQACGLDPCDWSWSEGVPGVGECVPCPEGTTAVRTFNHYSRRLGGTYRGWCASSNGEKEGPYSRWEVARPIFADPPQIHGWVKAGYAEGLWWMDDHGWVHYERGLAQGSFASSNADNTLTGAYLDGNPHGRWILQTPEAVYVACYEGRGGLVVDPPRVILTQGPLPPCPPADHIDGPFQTYTADGAVIASGEYRDRVPYGLWDAPLAPAQPNLRHSASQVARAPWRGSGSFDQKGMQGLWLWGGPDPRDHRTQTSAVEMVNGRRSGRWQVDTDTSTFRARVTPAEGGWEIQETLDDDGAVTNVACRNVANAIIFLPGWTLEDAEEIARPWPACPRTEVGG